MDMEIDVLSSPGYDGPQMEETAFRTDPAPVAAAAVLVSQHPTIDADPNEETGGVPDYLDVRSGPSSSSVVAAASAAEAVDSSTSSHHPLVHVSTDDRSNFFKFKTVTMTSNCQMLINCIKILQLR